MNEKITQNGSNDFELRKATPEEERKILAASVDPYDGPTVDEPVMASERPLTFGERAVGLAFNPSGDNAVHTCKRRFASAIDQMNDLRQGSTNGEQKRYASAAITLMEQAQMMAVKAITWKD